MIHGTRRLDLALLGVGPRPAPATRCAAHLRCSFRSSLSVFLPVLRCGGFVAPQPGRRVRSAERAGTSSAGLVQLCSCSADFPRLRLSSREPLARCLPALERQWRVRFCPFCRDITPARPGSGAICSFNCCMLLSLAPPYRPSTTSAPGGHCRACAPAPERTFRGGRIGAARGPRLEAQQGRAQ